MESAVMKILALAVLASIASAKQEKDIVVAVQQNYKPEIDNLLIEQIQRELTASYIYQAYASYFQRADVSLPGIQKFFADASLEERGHAEKLIDYVNKRGGHAKFDTLDVSQSTTQNPADREGWKEGLMAFEDALVIERFVNAKLLQLHAEADTAGDGHLGHILEHDFLDEQVHAIYEIGQHVFRLRKFASGDGRNYKLGEYLFDESLQKKSA
ncbi:hypothetical protein EGW08_012653 [Elysia chlorotica]|uniref:Ferritin n=1 Tax=Elysia chlorotica TaxID=188477 RepID=A0A3S1B4D8_ELYCH|nr:hypothetical protein EGW08_012653 [Elysia chlorotica]